MINKFLAATALAALIPLTAVAQPAPELPAEAVEFLEQGATIKETWWVNDHIIGIALEATPTEGLVVFADASGQFLLSGTAIDVASGKNVAEKAMQEHFPEPGVEQMYAEAEDMHWIEVGGGAKGDPIYVIADTQCGYCHELARTIAREGVQRPVRWVLVGYLGPRSNNQAAGLLEASARPAANGLWKILTGKADGMPEVAPENGARRLQENNQWSQKWGVQGTPMLLVPHQGRIQKVSGLPEKSMWGIIAP